MASIITQPSAIFRRSLLVFTVISFFINSRAQEPPLDPATQVQFVNQLPVPKILDGRNGGIFTISVTQFFQDLGLKDPKTGEPLLTKVWGYNGSYPGPTILAQKNVPLEIFWQNSLLDNRTGRPLPHLLPVDESIEWAFSGVANWQQYGVPIVTHLHGGHTEAESDGSPNAWFTPSFTKKGSAFFKGQTQPYYYKNDQDAATIWCHDHALGITRLNVYAGLAGYYILTDEKEQQLKASHQLPANEYDMGLAIQDRMFTQGGQLYYPFEKQQSDDPEPSIIPEFFGNFILVNGKVWPVLDVEPRQYRFRVLNGSDSRFYNLFFSNDQVFWQIGSDQGLLANPVQLDQMIIGPGQRKEIIVDFSDPSLWGQTLILKNNARSPYPKGTPVEPAATGRIMAFRISKPLNKDIPLSVLPSGLTPIAPLPQNGPTRQLLLFEAEDEFGRLKPMLGTIANGVSAFMDDVTEHIQLNDTETWEIFNATEDAHPIHLHLVKFQALSRQKYFAAVDQQTGKLTNVRLVGRPHMNNLNEDGWKDTEIMLPGEVTRIRARFDLPGLYVWHCHILSHEDHEMMRPFLVSAPDITAKKETALPVDNVRSLTNWPNPFAKRTYIQLALSKSSMVTVNVFDLQGRRVQQVFKGVKEAGFQQFEIDGSNWVNGIYLCEVYANDSRHLLKLIYQK